MSAEPTVVRPPRSRRGSTPWTEVLAMSSLQVNEKPDDDEGAVFDPDMPRDMSR
jgi:hypothetical protein